MCGGKGWTWGLGGLLMIPLPELCLSYFGLEVGVNLSACMAILGGPGGVL